MIDWPKVVGWVLSGLLGLMLIASGALKFFPMPEEVAKEMPPGLVAWIVVIAVGEITSAVLFLLPWTASFGTLLLSSLMGGAILFHMSRGEPFIVQSVILILIWLAGYLRGTWSFWRRES